MKQKQQLSEYETRSDDAPMCDKYYLHALCTLALKAGPGTTNVQVPPCSPEDFSKLVGHRPFTQAEYLDFLGVHGFNVGNLTAHVASTHQEIDQAHSRAKAFFDVFKTEWVIEQTDIEKYLDHSTIHHFIALTVADAASTKARIKAIKRHAENHAMKSEVFQWLESQGKFKSNEAAATAITKQQPIAHVTARDWYKEWKKLRSASTP